MPRISLRFGAGEVVFALLFLFSSMLTWRSAALISAEPERSPVLLLTGLLVAAVAYGVLAVVEPVSRNVIRITFALAFLIAVPFAFSGGGAAVGFPVALLAALLAELGMWRARRARESLRRPLLIHTARRALPAYFSAVSVMLTAIVFFSPILAAAVANPIPDSFIRVAIRWADPIFESMLGYSLEGTLDDILTRSIEQQLPPGEMVDSRLLAAQREQYARQYGIPISGDETAADIVIQLINKQTQRFEEQIASYYRIGFFLSAFFLFQLLSLPFSWVTILFLSPLVGMLHAGKVMVNRTVQAPRTFLTWQKGAYPQSAAPHRLAQGAAPQPDVPDVQ